MELTRVILKPRPPWLTPEQEIRLPIEPTHEPRGIGVEDVDLGYVLEERYRRLRAPLTARLPFHYHRLPARLRLAAAKLRASVRKREAFPQYPVEPSVDALRWARGERPLWPQGRHYAVLLTHDVDTASGAAIMPALVEIEEALAVRSTFFICSHHYELDFEFLRAIEYRGFEIASHGFNHDNRLAFLPEEKRCMRLDAIQARLGSEITLNGFRAASLLRTPELLQSLSGRFIYDSSIPDVDLELGGGCATVFPYLVGSLIEIPITLPMDSSLLYTGESPERVFEIWTEKLAWIEKLGGVATAVLHAEPQLGGDPSMRLLFADWIATLGERAWVTTPSQLIRHLRQSGFFAACASEPMAPEARP